MRLVAITKRFAGVTALDRVDLDIGAGEVHALVGENGAGKSTLVRILTGAYQRTSGEIYLDGDLVSFATPSAAQAMGVIAVHQEIHLLQHRTVAENVFLGREPRRFGLIDWPRLFADTAALLGALHIDVDPRATLGKLRTAQQQMVAIARGVSFGARVLMLDEPTSSLSGEEVAVLFTLIAQLKSQGTGIFYISHRFDELYEICDRVTVLRDGRLVATRRMNEVARLDLVCLMLGKSREELGGAETSFGAATRPTSDVPLLRVTHLKGGPRLHDVSLDVRSGEVVGLAGLLGSGRTETARTIFGVDPSDAGEMSFKGAPLAPHSPADALSAGLAFLSEDRKAEGIIPELSVRENLTLAALPTLTRFGIVDRRRQSILVDTYVRRLGIKSSSPNQPIRELSGGNQQKVLFARCLCTHPQLLIVDEPTRGIDVGARGEIQSLLHELAQSGLGVLMISSDLEELIEGSTRVVVLREGRTIAVLPHKALSQDAVIRAMVADAAPDEADHSASATRAARRSLRTELHEPSDSSHEE